MPISQVDKTRVRDKKKIWNLAVMNSYEATCLSTRKYLAPQMYFNVVAIIFGTLQVAFFLSTSHLST